MDGRLFGASHLGTVRVMKRELYEAITAVMVSFDQCAALSDEQQSALEALNELADKITDCGRLLD